MSKIQNFLDPEHTLPVLVSISTFVTCFEYIKHTITDKVRSFFDNEYLLNCDSNYKPSYSKEYQSEILSRKNKSAFHGSINWFREMGAISEEDIRDIDALFLMRNTIVHNIHKIVMEGEGLPEGFHECRALMLKVLDKIEKWWVINIEIPISGDFTAEEYDSIVADDIQSGSVMLVQLLTEVASGNREFFDLYMKHVEPT